MFRLNQNYTVHIWHIGKKESMNKSILNIASICTYSPSCVTKGISTSFIFILVEEDPTHTNIGILACIGRTTDAPHISRKTSPHESFHPNRDFKPFVVNIGSFTILYQALYVALGKLQKIKTNSKYLAGCFNFILFALGCYYEVLCSKGLSL